MELIDNGPFVNIKLSTDDYKYGLATELKRMYGHIPHYRPISEKEQLENLLYAPFTKEEVETGEAEFICFIRQFEDQPF